MAQGDAALFNLGLLTSDMYGMLFAYFIEKQSFSWLYVLAFAIIMRCAGASLFSTLATCVNVEESHSRQLFASLAHCFMGP
jgi:Solute carrier family 35